MSPSSFAWRALSFGALALLACTREPSAATAPKPSAKPATVAKPSRPAQTPAEAVGMPGPVVGETTEAHHHAAPPPQATSMKTVGVVGDDLEGDVSYFKLVSIKPCTDPNAPAAGSGGAPNPAARKVVAAEVEITAKTRLNVNPRDLMLGKGGIMFNASVDPKRELKGCSPLLKLSFLQARESAKGYVLFDLPTWGPGSNVNELNLVYHPARFGGSAQVYVKLAGS